MNSDRLQRVFQAARQAPPPEPPAHFSRHVLNAVIRESPITASLADQLAALFPRVALAAGLVVLLGVGVEWWHTAIDSTLPASADNVLTEQWLFATTEN